MALDNAAGSVLWALMTAAGCPPACLLRCTNRNRDRRRPLLLSLAFKALRAAASAHAIGTVERQRSSRAYVLRGLAIQMTKPKAVRVWIAVMSLGMQHDAPLWVVGGIVVGTSSSRLCISSLMRAGESPSCFATRVKLFCSNTATNAFVSLKPAPAMPDLIIWKSDKDHSDYSILSDSPCEVHLSAAGTKQEAKRGLASIAWHRACARTWQPERL
jgi:hypothetical protein